ncbi:hypothetical protein [Actinomadura citrea]|uniref:Uncharacterized protein n=1 Tax=Actinomadura citrea TaxID=46158 RepID=A0A7Y9GJ59_9ACTN|nr:hypothetical protein [Actinomadura citrea]NYE17490.1 hypothetical protein [Actinomadura citrea]GGU01235.1 hypothetical protein GCM10010177_70770 [Actinomadura citrea]
MGLILRLIVAAGLAADAIVHWKFAPDMAFVQGGSIDGDLLFRVQAAVAGVVAVIVLTYATRWAYALAFLVAAGAAGAVVLYYYVDVGALGPLPDMHEPVWYLEKTISLAGEGGAALAALVGVFAAGRGRRADDELLDPEPAGRF